MCVTYIPAYMTKPRWARRTISDGQTTQRTPHSLNMCAVLLISYRYAEKPLEVRGKVERHTSASLVLCIQTAFQPIDPEWVQVLILAMLTVWHRNKVPLLPLPLLLHAEQGCLQGESCLVQSTYGSIKPQERACWTLVNRSSGNWPSKSMNQHFHPPVYAVTSKKEHFQRLFIPRPLNYKK